MTLGQRCFGRAARDLLEPGAELLALADAVEVAALQLLRESKPGRRLETNVEFYTALLLHALELKPEWFTAVFRRRSVRRLVRPQLSNSLMRGG